MGAPTVRMESAMLLSEFIAGPHEAATARSFAQEAIELAAPLRSPLVAAAGHESW